MEHTPLLENAPRILVHTRGLISPEAADFWQRLRFVLREHGHDLMLMGDHFPPQKPIDAPWLRVRCGLDAVVEAPYCSGWSAWLEPDPAFDAAPYLERERLWHGPESDAAQTGRRVRALHHFRHFYQGVLKASRPALALIWNGGLPQELLLRDLCRACGCPVHYAERAPFEGAIQIDSQGILGATAIAQSSDWTWPAGEDIGHWGDVMAAVERHYAEARETWWSQPKSIGPDKLRKRLRIAPGQKVVLFAGQIDHDAQNMLYSPHFENNLAAFQWFCGAVRHRNDILILGKHHPRSQTSPGAFRDAVGDRGVWLTDVALEDCMAVADRVAAVNSTVLYEGLMMNKPALCMGQGLLSGKGIAYEVERLDAAENVIEAWLEAADFPARKERWNDFGAFLLSSCLYSMKPSGQTYGQRDVHDVAAYLVSNAADAASLTYGTLELEAAFLDELALWDEHRARFKQHEGFKEVLRGINIALKASLGAMSPAAYRVLERLGNRLYAGATRRRR